jgi:copper chaperone CopZ
MNMQHIKLKGFTCGACVKLAQKRLQQLPQVQRADVSLDGSVDLQTNEEIPLQEIVRVLEGTPYQIA